MLHLTIVFSGPEFCCWLVSIRILPISWMPLSILTAQAEHCLQQEFAKHGHGRTYFGVAPLKSKWPATNFAK